MPARPSARGDRALVHDAVAGERRGPPRAGRSCRRRGAGTGARGAACRRCAIGRPSSLKPSAPASRSSAISVSSSPSIPRGDRGQEADRHRGARRGPRSRSASTSAAVETGGSVLAIAMIAAVAAGGGRAGPGLDVLLVLVAGRAQVDVGVEEGREGVQAGGLDHLGALGLGASPARPSSAIRAVADDHVVGAVDPGDAGRARVAPRRTRSAPSPARMSSATRRGSRRLPAARSASAASAPARARRERGSGRSPPAPAARRGSPSARRGRRRPARSISDCGESITSPESSTPRLTGPGCISSCRGPSRRESIWKWAAYSRSEGTKLSLMRSCCIRSA